MVPRPSTRYGPTTSMRLAKNWVHCPCTSEARPQVRGWRSSMLFVILRGLLVWRLTGGQEAVDRLAENYYGQFIEMAVEGRMAAVARSEHFKECIRARPA